jgi:hypothetical protein
MSDCCFICEDTKSGERGRGGECTAECTASPVHLQIHSHNTLFLILFSNPFLFPPLSLCAQKAIDGVDQSISRSIPATEPRASRLLLAVRPRLVAFARRKQHASHPPPSLFFHHFLVIFKPFLFLFPFLAFSLSRHSPLSFGPPLCLGRRVRLSPLIVCRVSTSARPCCPLNNPSPHQRRQVLGLS